jgi:hypothetical protein
MSQYVVYKSSPAFSVPGDKPEITPAVLPTFVQCSSSPWIPWPTPSSCTLWVPLQSCLARLTIILTECNGCLRHRNNTIGRHKWKSPLWLSARNISLITRWNAAGNSQLVFRRCTVVFLDVWTWHRYNAESYINTFLQYSKLLDIPVPNLRNIKLSNHPTLLSKKKILCLHIFTSCRSWLDTPVPNTKEKYKNRFFSRGFLSEGYIYLIYQFLIQLSIFEKYAVV